MVDIVSVDEEISIVPLETVQTRYGLFIRPVEEGNDGFGILNATTQHQSFRSDNQVPIPKPTDLELLISNQFDRWDKDDAPVIISKQSLTVKIHPSIDEKVNVEEIIEKEIKRIQSNN